ncbi:MAG: hypothetical protein ACOX56_04820 [Acholeplasmataceae bacterium]
MTKDQKERIEMLPDEQKEKFIKEYELLVQGGYVPKDAEIEIRLYHAEGLINDEEVTRLIMILFKEEEVVRNITADQVMRINQLKGNRADVMMVAYQMAKDKGKEPTELEVELMILRAKGKLTSPEVRKIQYLNKNQK